MPNVNDVYVYDLNEATSMNDNDYFLINQGSSLLRLKKTVLVSLLNNLSQEQINNIDVIQTNGNGSALLDNSGTYRYIKLADLNDLNSGVGDIINKFTIDNNGQLLYNGQVIGSNYELPIASVETLGGVKVDGTTITIDENGTISGASTYELPKATTTNLGGIMVDGSTITVNADGVITCINEGSVIATWASNVEYPINCVVVYETTMYKCLETHTSGETFDSTKWTALTGEKGDKGEDGFSPIVKIESIETGATITVTDSTETTTVDIINGKNGENGITPHIDEITKHWMIDETDTGILAEGSVELNADCAILYATFTVNNWSETAPYMQTVTVNGITSNNIPVVDVAFSDDSSLWGDEQKAYGCLTKMETVDNGVVGYCLAAKPENDFTVKLKIAGDITGLTFVTQDEFDTLYEMINSANTTLENTLNGGETNG